MFGGTVLHRVEVDVVDVGSMIAVIADRVVQMPNLPDAGVAFADEGSTAICRMRDVACEPGLDHPPAALGGHARRGLRSDIRAPADDCCCPGRGIRVLVVFMDPADPRTPAERFAGILAWLNRSLAAAAVKNRAAAPLILLLWPRLNRLAARFASLAARVAAGTATPRQRTLPRPAGARPRKPYARLPRRFGWLLRLEREAAAAAGSQLRHLLADPEMADILAAAPQAGRLLRPLCRMLGVQPPPALAPAPRRSRPRTAPNHAAAAPAAPPSGPPPRGSGEVLRRAGPAAAAARRRSAEPAPPRGGRRCAPSTPRTPGASRSCRTACPSRSASRDRRRPP